MITGTVKYVNEPRGYAFISRDDGLVDEFVHVTQAQKARIKLMEGLRLAFDVVVGYGGRSQAANLRRVD